MRRALQLLSVLATFIVLILSGCYAGVTVSKAPVLEDLQRTFLIPKNENISGHNYFLKGLTYNGTLRKYYPFATSTILNVHGIEIEQRPSENLIVITYHNGKYYPGTGTIKGNMYTSYIRYYIDVRTEEKENNFVLTYKLKDKEIGEGRSPIGRAYKMPSFSEYELFSFLSKPTIKFKTEIDSPYNPESTYGNFRRLLERKGYKEGYKDPVTGKIFTESFIMPKMNTELFVEVYPYRNGSKAVITVHHPIKEDHKSKYIDLGGIITDIKKRTEEIVRS